MRDVDNGYILRYTHANVASFFFIFVYAHFNFTNFFINLFKFFACLPLPTIRQFCKGKLWLLPKHDCSDKRRPYGSVALNVNEKGGLKLNILVLLKNCANWGLKIHYNKFSLSQLWLNCYVNAAPNFAEGANSNLKICRKFQRKRIKAKIIAIKRNFCNDFLGFRMLKVHLL